MRFGSWLSLSTTRSLSILGLCGLSLLAACAEDKTTDEGGEGGSAGTAGSAGNGGTGGDLVAGSGGDAGTAGTAGTGASGGSAGTGATGGTAGTGAGGTGGSSGSAGSSGNGGIGGVGPDATITDGAEDRILLTGLVVTPDQAFDGQVLVEGEDITCVEMGTGCEGQSGASGATRIDTNGIILPGLIDTHNHILFDVFDNDDWVPHLPASCTDKAECVSQTSYCRDKTSGTDNGRCDCVDSICRYTNHNYWGDENEYKQMLDYKQCFEDVTGKPVWCPIKYDGAAGKLTCELDKWGELKGLIAGTTSIVGLPSATGAACFASLSRSIDVSQNDLPGDKIQASSLFPPSSSSANAVCANFADGDTDAYLIHVGEGVDAAAQAEWGKLSTVTTPAGCLLSYQTTITHGVAFSGTEFAAMASAGMKLTWSPASNIALYGKTADIPTALNAGVTVALGPDWSMGGSQNLLDELRFADSWDNSHWGDNISTEELVRMVTTNAAQVVGLGSVLGKLEAGYKADIMVIGGDVNRPFDSVVAARPKDVRLVMVGGKVLFGDDQLEAAGPANPGCEAFDACGRNKFLCVAEASTSDKFDQTKAQIETILNGAFQELDNLAPLPASDCGSCPSGQSCFTRTNYPLAAPGDCPTACGTGEACFHTAQSGTNQYNCLTVNTCAMTKTESFYPITPLLKCD